MSTFPLAVRSQRALQVVLGLFWIVDAALQFQPFMFGRGFVATFVVPNAAGQPAVLGELITHAGRFLSPDIAVWNTFFALLQLGIGLGLLVRRSVRVALVTSFVWVACVWVVGEGMGMLLTGRASALTGAPGSVLLYGLLGLMAWPRPPRRPADWSDRPVGIATSAAAQGIGRSVTPLAVWAGYWFLAAVLFVLPDNRTATSVQSAVVGMAAGQPGWYAHFLTDVGNLFSSSGTQTAWILAAASLVIGAGPLVARRPGWFLAAGATAAVVMWVLAQGLVGNVFTGSDTDPNSGPLVVVLAASMVPAVLASREEWRSPAAEIVRRSPAAAALGVVALMGALALSGTYPPASPESTGSAMAGMVMGGGGTTAAATEAATSSTCHRHQVGMAIAGLDLANTPYMIMSGANGMDMNGADASAAAGFNTTKPNWHYTGPALPQAEAQLLLRDGGNGPADVRMAVDGCAPAPHGGPGDRGGPVRAADHRCGCALHHSRQGGGRRLRGGLSNQVSRRLLRQPGRAGRQRGRRPHTRPAPRGRPGLRGHVLGEPGARRRHVRPPDDGDVHPHALRRTRPVAPADPGLWARNGLAHHAAPDHRVPALLPGRLGGPAHPVPLHGLAAAGGRRAAGHPATGHPGGRSGGHAATERMIHRDDERVADSTLRMTRGTPGSP